MKKQYRFLPAKPEVFFKCEYGVFNANCTSSVCYTTDKKKARLVSIALNRFLNSREGQQYLIEKDI